MKKTKTADIILHFVIVVTTVLAVMYYFVGSADMLGSYRTACLKYFTTDSNILACICSIIYLVYVLRGKIVPQWVTVLKFVGTVAVSVTLFTVIFFLAPMGALNGNGIVTALMYFAGNSFVLHFSTPVLAIITTLFLERDEQVTKKQAALGVLPTLVYGIVYVILVVFVKVWYDWYGFTFGGRNEIVPVSLFVILVFTLGLGMLERRIKQGKREQ